MYTRNRFRFVPDERPACDRASLFEREHGTRDRERDRCARPRPRGSRRPSRPSSGGAPHGRPLHLPRRDEWWVRNGGGARRASASAGGRAPRRPSRGRATIGLSIVESRRAWGSPGPSEEEIAGGEDRCSDDRAEHHTWMEANLGVRRENRSVNTDARDQRQHR